MLAYIPVFFLVELFKRTSNRISKSEKLHNIIKTISTSENIKMEEIKIKNGSSKNKNKKCFPFPWWFKIILYCISYACMALSICSIMFIGIHFGLFLDLSFLTFINKFEGIEFGNDNVRNWLISLAFSFLIGMLVTLPFQVTY